MNNVLIVDDIEENRYLLKVIMQSGGYEVVEAQNGRDALEAAHRCLPKIVVSDILMPKMDGFQLCREWMADSALKDIPFVFYTATYTDNQDETFALRLGADLFLRKPQEPDFLVRKIRETIESRRRLTDERQVLSDEKVSAEYESVLFKKLEKKVMELEQTNARLERQIAERKAAERARADVERQLRHSQRMEALGTLSGHIAHDFKNFIHGIDGYVGMTHELLSQVPLSDKNTTKAVGYLDVVQKNCRKATELVQQIRTFSTEVERNVVVFSLGRHVGEALKFLKGSLPASIELEEQIDLSCRKIVGDPVQIHQLVVNLCLNGFEAMQGQGAGTLTVSLKEETVTEPVPQGIYPLNIGTYIVLRISDTGEGMSSEIKEHIFDPYFTTKSERGGTGLGLSVVHGIVQGHGASITVDSRVGEGTTFSVFFP